MQIIILNGFDTSYFRKYKEEFSFIKQHYDKYNVVPDAATLIDLFPSFDLIEVSESEDYLIDKLQEQYVYDYAVPQINELIKLMSTKQVDKSIDHLMSIATDLTKVRKMERSIDLISQADLRFEQYLIKTRELNKLYIPTGLKELDKILGGWDVKEDFVIISARPGVGKSWVLFNFAASAAKKGYNVGLYSGEISEHNVGYRIDTLLYHISNWAISHGDINVQTEYEEIIKKLKEEITGSIRIITPKMLGGMASISQLRAFVEREKLDMLLIDQFSLLRDERGAKDRTIAGENLSKDLKILQQILGIPIIVAAQLGRGAVSKDKDGAGLEDLAITDRLGQDASVALSLEQKDKLLAITILKNRFGASGDRLNYLWDKNKGEFLYSPTERDALKGESNEDLRTLYNDSEENNF